MWFLAAMPMLVVAFRKEYLPAYLDCFMAVLVVYATALIFEMMLGVKYNEVNYYIAWRDSWASSWPVLDPNNAAAIINVGLIPSFYMALRKRKWFIPFTLFAVAMFSTGSKAGPIASLIACGILFYEWGGWYLSFIFYPIMLVPFLFFDKLAASFANRLPIWKASMPLLGVHPLTGLGLGSFGYYYNQVRTETETGGRYAHNDLLQFAIEGGIPLAIVFCVLIGVIWFTTNKNNIVSACALLAVLLQSMVEFQFYVPATSLLVGLAVAYHQMCYKSKLVTIKA
jgi:O-antigen ligase